MRSPSRPDRGCVERTTTAGDASTDDSSSDEQFATVSPRNTIATAQAWAIRRPPLIRPVRATRVQTTLTRLGAPQRETLTEITCQACGPPSSVRVTVQARLRALHAGRDKPRTHGCLRSRAPMAGPSSVRRRNSPIAPWMSPIVTTRSGCAAADPATVAQITRSRVATPVHPGPMCVNDMTLTVSSVYLVRAFRATG